MARSAPGAADRLLRGADAHVTTVIVAVARQLDAGPLGGGVSVVAAADLCPGTEGEIGLSPEIGTTNPQDLSLDREVAPDPTTGSKMDVETHTKPDNFCH